MKIYIGHSRAYDFENELYVPIRSDAELNQQSILLPHENNSNKANSQAFYGSIDLFIAEVSYPATGLGIELGWAYDRNTPIVCISKTGSKVSGSLKSVTDKFYEYNNKEDLVKIIRQIIATQQNN